MNAQRPGQYCLSDADLLEQILTAALERMDNPPHRDEETTCGTCWKDAA